MTETVIVDGVDVVVSETEQDDIRVVDIRTGRSRYVISLTQDIIDQSMLSLIRRELNYAIAPKRIMIDEIVLVVEESVANSRGGSSSRRSSFFEEG